MVAYSMFRIHSKGVGLRRCRRRKIGHGGRAVERYFCIRMCEAGTVFECSVGWGSFQAFFGGRDEGYVLVGEGGVFFVGVVNVELVGGEGEVVDV